MSLPVRLKDVVEALDEGNDMCSHYMDKRTGEVLLITNEEMSAAEDELVSDYPDWQQDSILKAREILESNDFVQLPGQFDVHEYSIMERFGQKYEDSRTSAELLRSIRGQEHSAGSRIRSMSWASRMNGMSFGETNLKRSRLNGWRQTGFRIHEKMR